MNLFNDQIFSFFFYFAGWFEGPFFSYIILIKHRLNILSIFDEEEGALYQLLAYIFLFMLARVNINPSEELFKVIVFNIARFSPILFLFAGAWKLKIELKPINS